MTIIKTSYVDSVNPELDDQELPAILYNALGITFYEFVEVTLDKVDKAINGRRGKNLYVRCFRTKKRKCGWCFKTGGGLMPDIVLGFCGDIKDLEITLIHELLHLFRWDEKMVEAKAREIYKNGRQGRNIMESGKFVSGGFESLCRFESYNGSSDRDARYKSGY